MPYWVTTADMLRVMNLIDRRVDKPVIKKLSQKNTVEVTGYILNFY